MNSKLVLQLLHLKFNYQINWSFDTNWLLTICCKFCTLNQCADQLKTCSATFALEIYQSTQVLTQIQFKAICCKFCTWKSMCWWACRKLVEQLLHLKYNFPVNKMFITNWVQNYLQVCTWSQCTIVPAFSQDVRSAASRVFDGLCWLYHFMTKMSPVLQYG